MPAETASFENACSPRRGRAPVPDSERPIIDKLELLAENPRERARRGVKGSQVALAIAEQAICSEEWGQRHAAPADEVA